MLQEGKRHKTQPAITFQSKKEITVIILHKMLQYKMLGWKRNGTHYCIAGRGGSVKLSILSYILGQWGNNDHCSFI